MKTLLTLIAVLLILAGNARADAWKDTVRGGLWGAAAGVLVSELSDDYEARYTIPLFTSIGALTGYSINKNRDAYYLPYLALPYAWYSHRRPAYRYYREPPRPIVHKQEQTPAPPKSIDRHPGVTLIPVPITLRNGTVIPIHILKLGDRYTGPQGEAYEHLPDAATLQHRYAP
jgi:hypothetical protein